MRQNRPPFESRLFRAAKIPLSVCGVLFLAYLLVDWIGGSGVRVVWPGVIGFLATTLIVSVLAAILKGRD
jgi:hypothetical protein